MHRPSPVRLVDTRPVTDPRQERQLLGPRARIERGTRRVQLHDRLVSDRAGADDRRTRRRLRDPRIDHPDAPIVRRRQPRLRWPLAAVPQPADAADRRRSVIGRRSRGLLQHDRRTRTGRRRLPGRSRTQLHADQPRRVGQRSLVGRGPRGLRVGLRRDRGRTLSVGHARSASRAPRHSQRRRVTTARRS